VEKETISGASGSTKPGPNSVLVPPTTRCAPAPAHPGCRRALARRGWQQANKPSNSGSPGTKNNSGTATRMPGRYPFPRHASQGDRHKDSHEQARDPEENTAALRLARPRSMPAAAPVTPTAAAYQKDGTGRGSSSAMMGCGRQPAEPRAACAD